MMLSPTSSYTHHPRRRVSRPSRVHLKAPSLLSEPRDFDIFDHLNHSFHAVDPYLAVRSKQNKQIYDYYQATCHPIPATPTGSIRSKRSTYSKSTTRSSSRATSYRSAYSPVQSGFESQTDVESIKVEPMKVTKRPGVPFPRSPKLILPPPTVHSQDDQLDSPRSSVESSSSVVSYQTIGVSKKRTKALVVPPPLKLVESNLDPKSSTDRSEIEIIVTTPPPSDIIGSSQLLSPTWPAPQPTSYSPLTPSFLPPPEEELRQKRLDKVMRTLGEDIPPELVVKSANPAPPTEKLRQKRLDKVMRTLGEDIPPELVIQSVNPIPSTSRPPVNNTLRPSKSSAALQPVRRGDFTSHLRPTPNPIMMLNDGRTRSREILDLGDTFTELILNQQHPQPQEAVIPPNKNAPCTLFTKPTPTRPARPIGPRPGRVSPTPMPVYAELSKALPPPPPPPPPYTETQTPVLAPVINIDNSPAESTVVNTPRQRAPSPTRAKRLSRRASISTSVVIPGSPLHKRFTLIEPPSIPGTPLSPRTATRPDGQSGDYAKQFSFQLVVDDIGAELSDTYERKRIPSLQVSQLTSTLVCLEDGKTGRSHLMTSNIPFSWTNRPVPFMSPSSTSLNSDVAKARRQSWCGEWNVSDMQDVISKLRDLR